MTKDEFLNNIKNSLQKTHLPDAHLQKPTTQKLPEFEPEALISQFTQEAVALKCEVYRAKSKRDALQQLASIFAQYQATDFMAWDDKYFPLPGLRDKLKAQGLNGRSVVIPHNGRQRQAAMESLSNVPIGLTGALAGLADTGTLALQSGVGRGRLASLLPPVHIALFNVKQLFPTMAHFLRAHPNTARNTSNLIFISGPSRTADIEQVLTLGVHGPKKLHIILL